MDTRGLKERSRIFFTPLADIGVHSAIRRACSIFLQLRLYAANGSPPQSRPFKCGSRRTIKEIIHYHQNSPLFKAKHFNYCRDTGESQERFQARTAAFLESNNTITRPAPRRINVEGSGTCLLSASCEKGANCVMSMSPPHFSMVL